MFIVCKCVESGIIPIGVINTYVETLPLCSNTTKVTFDLSEEDDHDSSYNANIGVEKEDIISSSQVGVLNQAIH